MVKCKRPVVGIIGNSYLMNNSYPAHSSGTMNTAAVAEVAGAVPLIIPIAKESTWACSAASSRSSASETRRLRLHQSLGFEPVSDEYLEDDIPHVEMLKKAG